MISAVGSDLRRVGRVGLDAGSEGCRLRACASGSKPRPRRIRAVA